MDISEHHAAASRTSVRVASAPSCRPNRLDRSWVSKTAMTRYLRCPYAFWMIDSGQISFEETLDEFRAELITEGLQFQDRVESEALPLPMAWEDVPLTSGGLILGTPLFSNHTLKIMGRPDGIDLGEGALFPVEIKSHKDVKLMDELELAFYWLLLEPHRLRRDAAPEGVLILRRKGKPVIVRVPINPNRITRVTQLLPQVLRAREFGVKPQVCGCDVCSTVLRERILASVARTKHPSLLLGVGRPYAAVLAELGFGTCHSLLKADPDVLAEHFRAARYYGVTSDEVRRWQLHARSYRVKAPVLAKDASPFPIGQHFISLDLEYDSMDDDIWLIGTCLVAPGDRRSYRFLWANTRGEQARNLRRLAAFLQKHPDIPVVTWSGTSAELPLLRRVSQRHQLGDLLDPLLARHVDLYMWTVQNLRFPFPGLTLKEVGAYYAVPRLSDIQGGFEAVALYHRYLRARDRTIKDRLTEYNQEDLDGLATVTNAIRALATPK